MVDNAFRGRWLGSNPFRTGLLSEVVNRQVGDAQEDDVFLHELDPLAPQRTRQRAVATAMRLQRDRRSSGYAHNAQAKFFVYEVKVVVQELPLIGPQIDMLVSRVQPELVAPTSLHRRDFIDQPRRSAAARRRPHDQTVLAEMALADVFDLDARGLAHLRRALADPIAQKLGRARGLGVANASGVWKARYPSGVARLGQRTCNVEPLVARRHAVQVRPVRDCQCRRSNSTPGAYSSAVIASLFGSGSAGLD